MVITVESSVSQGSHHVTASKLAFSSTESGSIERPTGTRRGRWKRLAREGMAYDPGPDPMFLRDFHEANVQGMNSQQLAAQSVKWRLPDAGLVKVNSDTAIDSSSCLVGFGLVVCDHLGRVLGSS
ncbi:hypothetical protein ACOSQ3_023542 [Xanthoceras sorbifolium]